MTHYLVKFEHDWADEFTLYGFRIFTESEWTKFQEALLTITIPSGMEFGFGTNEYVTFDDTAHYKRCLEAKKLTATELGVIMEHFGSEWGHFIDAVERLAEDDEDYEEEDDE